ncbi:Uncharacterised protein [Segatella copri]|nr:Uncharacterised protein [Segatella copri]
MSMFRIYRQPFCNSQSHNRIIRKTRLFVYIEVPMLHWMKFIRSPEAIASDCSYDTSCRYSFTSYMSHEYILQDGNI